MKTESLYLNGYLVPLFWLSYYYESVIFGHTHTKNHPNIQKRFRYQKLLRPSQKPFCIVELENKTESSCLTDCTFLSFWLSDYCENTILVIYTHKITLALI